jgi:hypothetical protein
LLDQLGYEKTIRGGNRVLTAEQKNWLMDDKTIEYHKEKEYSYRERAEDFCNKFPDAPRLRNT